LKYYQEWRNIACLIDVEAGIFEDNKVIYRQISLKDNLITTDKQKFRRNVEQAKNLSNISLLSHGVIELEGLTECEPTEADIHYSTVHINGVHKIAISYTSHVSNTIYVPIYVQPGLPYDDFEIRVGEIPVDVILSPSEIFFLSEFEFENRKVKKINLAEAKTKISTIPKEVLIDDSFKSLSERIANNQQNVFITGNAGTGKSTFLKYFVSKSNESLVVLAPTGVAALNAGGSTIHSFFKFPHHALDPRSIDITRQAKYKNLDTIIIDEISMVRSDMMDAIDIVLRANKKSPLPFGGVKIVIVGDLFQLPPVLGHDENLRRFFVDNYKSEWFFDSSVIESNEINIINLRTVHRQKDKEFIQLLNAVRFGEKSQDLLNALNQGYGRIPAIDKDIITLTPINAKASQINGQELIKLPTKAVTYIGSFNGSFYRRNLPADRELVLKIDAQVMFVRNDPSGRWVNGTIGKVHSLTKNAVKVLVEDEIYDVQKATWQNISYEYDSGKKKLIPVIAGEYTQYPLKLAWAMTIHKSQGKTFDSVILDLDRGAFAPGQLYVALSRCKTLNGIYLKQKIRSNDVITDQRVLDFFGNRETILS